MPTSAVTARPRSRSRTRVTAVLNSTGDVLFCLIGFLVAFRVGGRASAVTVLVTEAALAMWIRDGLLLNVIMLLYPLAAIRRWQLGV